MDDDLYLGADAAQPTRAARGRRVGPWELVRWVADGGTSEVWSAEHCITREVAAIKLMGQGARPERIASETLALRMHNIPGVVHLLDYGFDGDVAWLATSLLSGLPLRVEQPRPWPEVLPIALQLFSTVARLHHVGLLHLDLKPSNILLDARGSLTLVDLGLAQGAALGRIPDAEELASGTVGYAAPEQLAGAWPDTRADVFSLGMILAVLMLGLPAVTVRRLAPAELLARLRGIPGLSEQQAAVVGEMLSESVEARPTDVLDLMDRLCLWWLPARGTAPAITGPERVLRCQSRGRHLLSLAEEAMGSAGPEWLVRLGVLQLDAAGAVRPSVGADSFLNAVGRSKNPSARLLEIDVDDLGASFLELERIAATLRWTRWSTGRSQADAAARCALLLVAAGLEQEARSDIERALATCEALGPFPAPLNTLLQEVSDFCRGTLQHDAAMSSVGEDRDALIVQRVRHRVRVEAARRASVRDRTEAIRRAAAVGREYGDHHLIAQAAGWLGHLRYQQGRYDEAARLHRSSLQDSRGTVRRVSALLNIGFSLLEIDELTEASEVAQQALVALGNAELFSLRARAEWLARSVAHRARRAEGPDDALCQVALELPEIVWSGLILLNEACIAWTQAHPDTTSLAQKAEMLLMKTKLHEAALLARCIMCCEHPELVAETICRIEKGTSTEILWQAWGILVCSGCLDPTQCGVALRLIEEAPAPHRRRETLAPMEFQARLVTGSCGDAKTGQNISNEKRST